MARKYYPKALYETPEGWGEVFWLSRRELNRAIASLKQLGWDGPAPSVHECIRWDYVGGGFYRRAGVRREDQETRHFLYDRSSRSWIPGSRQFEEPEDARD
jgi:hypothetical protein